MSDASSNNGDGEPALRARDLHVGYDGHDVVVGLDLDVVAGGVTAIVGANASGKSTLLRALGRLLSPSGGSVLLDGREIHRLPTREVARRLGLLPQSPIAPEGITVVDLVARGRYARQSRLGGWNLAHRRAVTEALAATATLDLAERPVDELSGGQRQRVWLALAIAQGCDVMLLDEPTTYLDIGHQLDVLDILRDLNARLGRTVVVVLHDLNLAARYADHLVAMRDGRVEAEGTPAEVLTEDVVQAVFAVPSRVIADPVTGTPHVIPISRTTAPVPVAAATDSPLSEEDP